MRWKQIYSVICGVLCVLLVAGCAHRRAEILARIMAEIDEPVEPSRPEDAPVERVSDLPPPPQPEDTSSGNTSSDATTASAPTTEPRLTIQPECLVRVSVEEDGSLNGEYPVNEIGAIDLGRIGPVFLQNLTEEEAVRKITNRLLKRDLKKATVSVEIMRASYDKVRVSGAVQNPGLIRIGAGSDISLNDVIRRAGGLRTTAKGTRVKIVRDGQLFAIPSVRDGEEYVLVTEEGEARVPDVALKNNDIAYVFASQTERRPGGLGEKVVLVLGEVKHTGPYRFPADEPCTIMYLIFKMGGLPPYADKKNIVIKRRDKDGVEEEIKVNAAKVLDDGNPDNDFPLEDGDRIVVPARGISLF